MKSRGAEEEAEAFFLQLSFTSVQSCKLSYTQYNRKNIPASPKVIQCQNLWIPVPVPQAA